MVNKMKQIRKNNAIYVDKESRKIIERYSETNDLGLGESADWIIKEWDAMRHAIAAKVLDKKKIEQKPWWKFWV